jgi:CheY-like chemotaxis protein
MQETAIAKGRKTLQRILVAALGWTLVLAGIVGLFLPVVPGFLLLAVGAFQLNRRYAWLRRTMDECRLRFPVLGRAFSKLEQAKPQDVGEAQVLCGTRKALIFDEDIEELALYAKPFEAHGVEVHKCASIEAAMRCMEREQFDLALLDQGSSAFEGRRIIRHLIRYNWPAPFIVLARRQDAQCVRQALELGAIECLEKPVSTAKMDAIVEHFLSKTPRNR